jgi:hypothetical protein
LPEALARSRNDSVLSRPTARGTRRGERLSFAQTIVRRFKSKPSRTIAGATLAAIMTGIVVNAMLLQHSHRIQPVELPATAKPEAPAAATPAAATGSANTTANAEATPAPAVPPSRPNDLGSLIEATATGPHSSDPIRDLLRGDSGGAGEAKHLTIAAQNALVKLGYSIKADGVAGSSTLQAIEQFERSRGLTVASEITPKLVKQLTAAANASAH